MDDTKKINTQTADLKNVLPDVVHSQQIPTMEKIVNDETDSVHDSGQNAEGAKVQNIDDISTSESISEQVPSKLEYSITESDNDIQEHTSHKLPIIKVDKEKSADSSLNIPPTHSIVSDNTTDLEPSRRSWNLEVGHNTCLSKESPVNLTLSSDSKESNSIKSIASPGSADNEELGQGKENERFDDSKHTSGEQNNESLGSEYLDSLNEDVSYHSHLSDENVNSSNNSNDEGNKIKDNSSKSNSDSEEIIKLDIRGHGVPKFPIQASKIIFGPPPEGSVVVDATLEPMPAFQALLSPFLVGTSEGIKVEEIFEDVVQEKADSLDKSPVESLSSGKTEKDLLIEEMTVDCAKEKENIESSPVQPKSLQAEDTISFTTLTTDYKTICEDYEAKLEHFEDAITRRDQLIDELTVTLQRSVAERDRLRDDNDHLTSELQNLQHAIAERPQSEMDTIKAQLSDYMKYQAMVKDDSTKFYSAVMSGTTSLQSSNGEKDIDREEITVNYSKSDLRSSDSEEFLNGFEEKVVTLLNKFEEYIEENLRNKLRESIIQVLCDEIGKMRIDYDTEIKDLEAQLQQDKQAFLIETRRLRELLASVKAGNADIDTLREELDVKHEKEMENLRTYFEKKCSDLERSYSEEVWRGKACSSPGGVSGAGEGDAAGDCRRRTRSAELPSFGLEATSMEQALKQVSKKHEQQMEDLKSEHLAYVNELQVRHREAVASLEEQLNRLKADIQTAENTEGNVTLYQQDIDLELEKGEADEARGGEDEMARLQVLLSDPDAELANWPLELAALRDKMHGDARTNLEKELPSLRDEVSAGDGDKWRQKRNNSYDQNRQLEEVTKERDALQHVASSLQHAVGQLVAYCASAEDELNRTVLASLLATILPQEQSILEDSRASSPNLSGDLNLSTVSRSTRHVHFAPELDGILAALDEEGAAGFLRHQRDLSADIKRELEVSLLRLRHEANELLDLSARLAANKVHPHNKMLESSQVEITELADDLEAEQKENCDNCELHKKTMEEAMSECLQREGLLRSDLEAAMVKIAQLLSDRPDSSDLIAEGYGTCVAPDGRRPGASRSLDDASPRSQINALARDLELLQHERDDLQQQLEAANRQLRSTRLFVEEQAAEREHERDEFAARLAELRDENARLAQRLHANARILAEVEQLETQTREMNQMISDLETRKASTDEELKSSEENVILMRDIIANLENQLEQKTKREADVLEQLEGMKRTIDERDGKMRALLGELESLRSEKADQSEIVCEICAREEDKYKELLQKVNEQCRWLEGEVQARTRLLQRAHEHADAACAGDHSEDVSLADHKLARAQAEGVGVGEGEWVLSVGGVREALRALARAEDAALKRIADLRMQREQLHHVAQEVRCERDVLQARMSEQALRISSLSARLTRQRHDADALAHQAHGDLGVRLHDANAEVQRLKEELESKDKQLARLRLHVEGQPRATEQSAYGDTSCEERAEDVACELEAAKERLEALSNQNRSLKEALAQRDRQLREVMALKLEEEEPYQRGEQPEGKASARTLSDVVSISEFDEQDLQMRRAELIAQNISPAFNVNEKSPNATLPPNTHHHMSSLNLDRHDTIELSPRAGSLPLHLTSTQNRELYKRNVNETTVFGEKTNLEEKETRHHIQDNCSLYPNRDADDTKNVSVEPKKIIFTLEAMEKTREEDIASLRELGVMMDFKQENFHDILVQLKNEVKRYRSELDNCKSELKNAEEQLCEFPALKEEVEELKGLLENTMATMENDKKFYENQLENFSSNKKLLEQRLAELTQEVNDKSKDLHLLKEDILRRENMILELAKEKRNLTNKLNELEVRIDELQSRNEALQKHETDNHLMKEKIKELEKLEQLVSEKNQQIDSLNQHLDRLDDLQRTLNDKTEELENLKEALRQKSAELYQMRDTVTNLNRDVERVSNENRQLDDHNRELKLRMSKVEKERENASLRLQNSENELERLNSANAELIAKLEEMENLKERMQEKENEVESLRAQINATPPRLATLRHELDFNRRELNDKAFELAKAKLDVTELRNSASEAAKQAADNETKNNELRQQTEALKQELQQLSEEKQQLAQQLEVVVARLREESNVSEIKTKLRERAESCHELEMELHEMRDIMESGTRGGARSPTAELERALRDQLHYSHALDDRIMDQILSASSDEHEHVPSLALDTSNTDNSGGRWSRGSEGGERDERGEWGSQALRVQVEHLRARLADKDALIGELNRIRDQLVQDWQTVKLRYEAERDNSGRLQLLLESQKETSESLQSQDANMIQILKKRLESAMQSESELLDRERVLRRRIARLEAAPGHPSSPVASPQALRHDLNSESESAERLRGEVSVLRTRLETERERCSEAQAQLQLARRQLDERQREAAKLRAQLAELKRLKQEAGEQLARAHQLLATQAAAVTDLERKLGALKQRPKHDSMTEVESVQSPLQEIAPEAAALHAELRALRRDLATRSQQNSPQVHTDDKDQAIRYLHGRCVRLESWRKALVWQKRYLQRVLAGYARLERALAQNPWYLQHLQQLQHMPHLATMPPLPRDPRPTGKKLFKCVVTVVVTVLRMEFLVRRRQGARAASACLLRKDLDHDQPSNAAGVRHNITGTPLLSPRGVLARRLRLVPQSPLAHPSPRQPRSPLAPLTPLGNMRTAEDEGKMSAGVNSPRNEFYLLNSPRGDVATGYLGKLQAVGRCLARPEGPADVP